MPDLDPTFRALELGRFAEVALRRATAGGASYASFRLARLRDGMLVLRDAKPETSTDSVDVGLAVRVLVDGAWGFAAAGDVDADAAARVADQAVAVARLSRRLQNRDVVLADEPAHPDVVWIGDYELNPFDVADAERLRRMTDLSERLLASDGVDHVRAAVQYVLESTFFADTAGSSITQQRVRIEPEFTATTLTGDGFETMRTIAPPTARGWEYLTGSGWDFDAEVAELPGSLLERSKAPSVEAGRYDLVIHPSNLWLTIHESIGHATELDRALGYEAAYAGTSFATPDKLGVLQYGSAVMNVRGERTTPHGLATVAYDDEGVQTQSFDIVRDGRLVGYQINREMAALPAAAFAGGRSNGCAFAESAAYIPLQRMPNVSLQAAPAGPSTEELIGRVRRGLYVVGDKSWSIDMQRYNFQFTAQRFYRIEDGRLAGQVRDAAYQATTTDFWGSMEAVGGESTYLYGGALNCGKGQPGQAAPVSHGSPAALFRDIRVLNPSEEFRTGESRSDEAGN